MIPNKRKLLIALKLLTFCSFFYGAKIKEPVEIQASKKLNLFVHVKIEDQKTLIRPIKIAAEANLKELADLLGLLPSEKKLTEKTQLNKQVEGQKVIRKTSAKDLFKNYFAKIKKTKKNRILFFADPRISDTELKEDKGLADLGVKNFDLLYVIVVPMKSYYATIFAEMEGSEEIVMVSFKKYSDEFNKGDAHEKLKRLVIKNFATINPISMKDYNRYEIYADKGVADLKNGDMVRVWKQKICYIKINIQHPDYNNPFITKVQNISHLALIVDSLKKYKLFQLNLDGTISTKSIKNGYTPLPLQKRLDLLKIKDEDTLYVRPLGNDSKKEANNHNTHFNKEKEDSTFSEITEYKGYIQSPKLNKDLHIRNNSETKKDE